MELFTPAIEKENILPTTYHHARPLESVKHGIVRSSSPLNYMEDRELANYFDKAYKWFEKTKGFYPLFLAVGRKDEDIRMTGIQNQWSRKLPEERNDVLFSFDELPNNGVFVDFDYWHIILNSPSGELTKREMQSLFRPSWIKNDWITKANKDPHSVQLLVRELDLRSAKSVLARNIETKIKLERMGFNNVSVKRFGVT
jgi:hypothetical protein